MTREEMESVAQYIRECLKSIEPHFCLTIVGSYRRGIDKSKDVDIVIYPDPNYYDEKVGIEGIMEDLLRVMREQTIIFQEGDNNFMGLVEHNMIFRRVDIWVVPIPEIITTLVGRTAYVETNKKLRLVATKKGYKVSNHGVYKRGGNRIAVKNEQEVFDMFGVEKDYKGNYCLQ